MLTMAVLGSTYLTRYLQQTVRSTKGTNLQDRRRRLSSLPLPVVWLARPSPLYYIKLTVFCVCSLTPPKLRQRTPPNHHRLRRTAWKVPSMGQRSPSYRCSGVLLLLPFFPSPRTAIFLIIDSACKIDVLWGVRFATYSWSPSPSTKGTR